MLSPSSPCLALCWVLSSACKTSVSPPVPQPPPASAEPAGASAPEARCRRSGIGRVAGSGRSRHRRRPLDDASQRQRLRLLRPSRRTVAGASSSSYRFGAHCRALPDLGAAGDRAAALGRCAIDAGRATLVDANHPGIEAMRRQVRLLAGARRLTLALDQRAVRGRLPAPAKLATVVVRQAGARGERTGYYSRRKRRRRSMDVSAAQQVAGNTAHPRQHGGRPAAQRHHRAAAGRRCDRAGSTRGR